MLAMFSKLFLGQPCVVCKSLGIVNTKTCGHHIIEKGRNAYYKFTPMNGLPLCVEHHRFGHNIAAHSPNSLEVYKFVDWMKKHLPRHYIWYEENNHRNLGNKLDLDLAEQILRDSMDNPAEFEEMIYG